MNPVLPFIRSNEDYFLRQLLDLPYGDVSDMGIFVKRISKAMQTIYARNPLDIIENEFYRITRDIKVQALIFKDYWISIELGGYKWK